MACQRNWIDALNVHTQQPYHIRNMQSSVVHSMCPSSSQWSTRTLGAVRFRMCAVVNAGQADYGSIRQNVIPLEHCMLSAARPG